MDVKTYYVDEAGTIQSKLKNLVLWTKPFTVGETAIRHTHAYVKDAAVEETCTGTGLTEGSHCESCGLIQTEQTIVPKADHTPGEAVKKLLEKGLVVFTAGTDVLRFLPPLVIEKKHVDEMIEKLESVLESL